MSRIGHKDVNVPSAQTSEELQQAREGEGGNQTGVAGSRGEKAKKVHAADAERMASQAGFVRSGAKKKGQGFDVGDSSQAPIPLPEDDVDTSDWSMEGLTLAQGQLLQHNAQLGRGRTLKKGEGLLAAFAAIVGGGHDGDGDGEGSAGQGPDEGAQAEQAARLQALAEQVPPSAAAMAALAQSVQAQFGIDFAGAQVGPALMATSLLVAGHPEDVQTDATAGGKGLVADKLLGGLQRVVEEGRGAAEDARRRSEGVNKNLAMHRTFVPKR